MNMAKNSERPVNRAPWPIIPCECGKQIDTALKDTYVMFFTKTVCKECAKRRETIKAISLWQPWASLYVSGDKRYETRHWATNHRGLLLIHAAKKWDRKIEQLIKTEPFASILNGRELPLGCIVGWVYISCCLSTDAYGPPSEQERAFGDWSPRRFAWRARDYGAFEESIPYRGAQGFFNVPKDLVEDRLPKPWEGQS